LYEHIWVYLGFSTDRFDSIRNQITTKFNGSFTMQTLLVIALLIVILLLGLSSISQSYASAKQAQAAIEASRAAQIASTGNLVTLVTVALVIVAVLAAAVLVAWLLLRTKSQPKRQWVSGPNANWGQVPQPQANALLPALLSMMLYQMMQSQQQNQQETEQFWLMNEPTHEMDVSTFSDNSTWDF